MGGRKPSPEFCALQKLGKSISNKMDPVKKKVDAAKVKADDNTVLWLLQTTRAAAIQYVRAKENMISTPSVKQAYEELRTVVGLGHVRKRKAKRVAV